MTKAQRDIEIINFLFSRFNLSVTSYYEGTNVNQYRVRFPYDIDINDLFNMQGNLIAGLHDNDVIVKQDEDELVIETKGDGKILTMNEVFYKSMYTRTNDFRLVLGKDTENNSITTLLPKAQHMLISECSGSEKTQLLHCFIASLLLGAETHYLILIAPKGNEFNVYKDIDTVEFIDDVSAGIQTLQWLVEEMNARYRIMSQQNTSDITKTNLTRIVCIIDEFADLIKKEPGIEKDVVLLTQKAGACGIHLIIGTQYPDVKVLTGPVKANVPTRICLKVNSKVQSEIVLGLSGGEKLLGYGDMLYLGKGMNDPVRIQAPYISDEDKLHVIRIVTPQLEGLGPKKQEKAAPEKVSYDHLIHPDKPKPERKRVGLIQGLINIMNAPPCTTPNDFTAMRASHRWNKT